MKKKTNMTTTTTTTTTTTKLLLFLCNDRQMSLVFWVVVGVVAWVVKQGSDIFVPATPKSHESNDCAISTYTSSTEVL
jgi:hypothetical protein